MIQLGDKVKDTITGFTGIACSRTVWLNGCKRIGIQPTKLKDGKPQELEYVDEQQCVVVKAAKNNAARQSGGPQPNPRRQADPPR